MPVGIHYTEAFANYVEFAAKSVAEGNPKSVVRTASQYAPFATAEMGTAPSDGPGGFAALFRSGASKKANDIARDIFRKSVYDIFGGESLVPPSVREAMKLEDYGSGKPLTARRILAVKEAIDQEMMRFAETFEAAKATAPKALRQADEKARAGELEILGEALRRCGLDRDAEAIVAKHADKFLLAPNESPRNAADVRAKVDRLLANLAELRAIAKGDAASKYSHYREFVEACLANDLEKCGSKLSYAAPLTEALLIGCVALRYPGEALSFDAKKMCFSNKAAANAFLKAPKRGTWDFARL